VKSSGGSIAAIRLAEEEDLEHWFLHPGGAQEKPTEGRDREPLDLIQKSHYPLDRTRATRGLPSGKAKVKSRKEG
jgi:hypothetical protein